MKTAGRGPKSSGAKRTVGQATPENEPSQATEGRARLDAAAAALDGRTPMEAEAARALLARAESTDAASLAADRAEAVAQLDAALAMLGPLEEPQPEAGPEPDLARLEVPAADAGRAEGAGPAEPPAVAVETLRDTARRVLAAAGEVGDAERAVAAAAARGGEVFERAQQAYDESVAAREAVPPAWRRTAGALISGTGMAIVILALAWPIWLFLVPAALISMMAFDLRVAAAASRAASIRTAEAMAAAGVAGPGGLSRAQSKQRARHAAATQSAADARARHAEARARWERLAPGVAPEDVEALIARLQAEAAAARPPSPPPPSPPPVLPLAARPERSPAPAPVDPEADKRCALAQRLADEARREIERAEQGLRDLAEAEHARRSLEWHDARAALR